ncbi:aprataxin-like [Gigantopelta aegis]|uniref:aprataxin-like n=1 Tax=Gigantopelta aegis TaxID=1735272 RepID=UPI001B889D26|nr:aprataxin-like [Gigantopelta aegis]
MGHVFLNRLQFCVRLNIGRKLPTVSKHIIMGDTKRKVEPENGPRAKKHVGHWSTGLQTSMEDPELRLDSDDKIVIIKDKYPKARFHFLVLPKEKISSLKSLQKKHVDILRHMHTKGVEIADKANKELRFRFGYHAVPSMGHLHLHVISQDFDSPCLKTKKHWNSFTTKYFIDSKDIIKQLEEKGKVEIDSSHSADLLKKDLQCHVCSKGFSTIPSLKSHIVFHNVTKKS